MQLLDRDQPGLDGLLEVVDSGFHEIEARRSDATRVGDDRTYLPDTENRDAERKREDRLLHSVCLRQERTRGEYCACPTQDVKPKCTKNREVKPGRRQSSVLPGSQGNGTELLRSASY